MLSTQNLPKEDRYIISVTTLVACILLTLLYLDFYGFFYESREQLTIGELSFSRNDVRRLKDGSYEWQKAAQADAVQYGDSVFTGEQSGAEISLYDGGVLTLRENTLLKIVKSSDKVQIELHFGEIYTDINPKKVEVAEIIGELSQKLDMKLGRLRIKYLPKEEISFAPKPIPRKKVKDVPQAPITAGALERSSVRSETAALSEPSASKPLAVSNPPEVFEVRPVASKSPQEGPSIKKRIAKPLPRPAKPRLVSVQDKFSTIQDFKKTPSRVEIIWDGVAKASAYTWELAKDERFIEVIQKGREIGERSVVALNPKEVGVFFFRVRAQSSSKGSLDSLASEAISFKVQRTLHIEAPKLLEPDDYFSIEVLGTQSVPVSFGWSKIEGVSSYRIELSKNSNFEGDLVQKESTGVHHIELFTPDSGIYFWRVRAEQSGFTSSWSKVRRFRLK